MLKRLLSRCIRLGPSAAYGVGVAYILSMLLLGIYPASPFVWALYMNLLPIMREPIYILLGLPGMSIWIVLVMLSAAMLAGVFLAMHPRLVRLRFLHAHVALLGLLLAMGTAASAQADNLSLIFPHIVDGDWAFRPIAFPLTGILLFVFVAGSCVPLHVAMIRRSLLRRRARRSAQAG